MTETYTAEQVTELCDKLLERVVAFHAVFAEITDSVTAGLMLSQAYFLSRTKTALKRGGWFWRTAEEWTADTRLTYSEQKTARKRLVGLKLLEEQLRGTPAKLWTRINQDELRAALLGVSCSLSPQQIIELYRSELAKLSTMNYAQAVKLGRKAEKVEYADIFVRDRGVCYWCGKQITKGPGQRDDALQFDHVIPRESGGEHTAENIRATHAGCNRKKAESVYKSLTNSVCKSLTNLSDSSLTNLPEGLLPTKVPETTSETTSDISYSARKVLVCGNRPGSGSDPWRARTSEPK